MIKTRAPFLLLSLIVCCCNPHTTSSPRIKTKDSIVYNIAYRDTTIYRYDTIRIKHYVRIDTVWTVQPDELPLRTVKNTKNKKLINPNNFGIGPSFGAYYSPFNGFDVNVGFSIQYYILSIPNFRKPHLHGKHNKK